jgi:hypothetical protein
VLHRAAVEEENAAKQRLSLAKQAQQDALDKRQEYIPAEVQRCDCRETSWQYGAWCKNLSLTPPRPCSLDVDNDSQLYEGRIVAMYDMKGALDIAF